MEKLQKQGVLDFVIESNGKVTPLEIKYKNYIFCIGSATVQKDNMK